MNRLIGRPAPVHGSKERVRSRGNGKNWLMGSGIALLFAVGAAAFAQTNTPQTTPPLVPVPPATDNVPVNAVEAPTDLQTDLKTVVEPKYEMDPTSLAPLGDDFSPATGTITFSATDISIPGNFAIPVALRRWLPSDDLDTGGPAGWKWNIPLIRGNYLDVKDGHSTAGFNWGGPLIWRNGKNCEGSAATVTYGNNENIAADSYWQGKLLHIPGTTSETFLKPANGDREVTKSHFKIVGCIDNNPPDQQGIVQQGIVVLGPDGTTYTFNQIKSYYNNKATLKDPIVRTRLLMVTKIKDRFNNEVNYNYDAAGNLAEISASDGRQITITYLNGEVQATAHGRTWTYRSNSDGSNNVTLPDGRQWSYAGLSALAFKPNGFGGYSQQLKLNVVPAIVPGCGVAAGDYPVTIQSPDGLQTTYTFRDTIHYRSDVEPEIYTDRYILDYSLSRALNCTVKRSLVSKTSSGPGVGPYTWNYTYSGNRGTYKEASIPSSYLTGPFALPAPIGGYPAPVSAGGSVNYRSVTVSGPDKQTVFYIDRKFKSISEDRVVAQDTLNVAGTQVLERSESSFGLGAEVCTVASNSFCEGTTSSANENQLNYHVNETLTRRIRYVGGVADATFSTEYPLADFDVRGRPKTVKRYGSGNPIGRTETILYAADNTTYGVMGQVESISIAGISPAMVKYVYNAKAQRESTTKFGIEQASYEYHLDGNLFKHIDGRGNVTKYEDYSRGQPKTITRANGAVETASVDDWGLITGRTDANGYSWSYSYDDAFRLRGITPPAGWSQTTISYDRATSSIYGLPEGHWRQTVDKGNSKTVTYFDALWRPLMVRSYDNDKDNEASTRKVVVKTFDVSGQVVFESYPKRDFTTVAINSPGRRMQYDALGRITRLAADSDAGELVTKTDYLSGFQTSLTNPRNNITTQGFWVLDNPNEALLAKVTAPEGVNVDIARNVLGNPTSIRRSGTANGVSADVTRSYVYDSGQRLCKTLEPELVATAQGYDGAGNIDWRATGVNLNGKGSCESKESVPAAKKITYTYDAVNQLATITYGDTNLSSTRTYWPDGLLHTIDYNGAFWSYNYNSLRKPTAEQLTYGGKTYDLGWNYDTNGNLSTLTYPTGGPTINYSANALGEPSQVGNYATGVAFHPNGAISSFKFGNNIYHSLSQTLEGTPKQNNDGTILQDLYTYDANGNVSAIEDKRVSPSGGGFSREMTYDNLDRLSGVTAPGVWSTATYLYDPADNLRTANVGSQSRTLIYDITTKRLDSVVTNGTTTAYLYDDNGNVSKKGSQIYTFDLGNRLVSPPQGGSYAYDGHGRRVKILSSDQKITRIQVYSQNGQLLWSEKNEVGTFPAMATYSCSTGTLMGQQCVTTSTYLATAGCNAGDSLSGGTCTHTTSYAAAASYSCPSGGSLSGSTCSRDDNYAASGSYSCPSGGTLSGSTCVSTSYVPASVNYSCAPGDTLHYTTCTTPTSTPATGSYTCHGLQLDASGQCNGEGTLAYDYYQAMDYCYAAGDYYGLILNDVVLVRGRIYNCVFQAEIVYSCPNGGMLSGSQCLSSSSYAAAATYTCNNGTLNGNQCAVTQYYTASSSYSCPSGGTLSGSTCFRTTSYTATPYYSCPSGGTLSGSSCTQTSSYSSAYRCNTGDSLSNSTCTHTTSIAATVVNGCPNGGTLTGNQCVGPNSIRTAYIYLEGKQIAETVINGATQYVHTDALGSPVAHTDQAGFELNRTKFEPYGNTAAGTKPGPTTPGWITTGSAIGFTGHVNDPETDLVYMQQRYYDPIAGRFLSIDPVTTDANTGSSFNRYAYANNSPYKFVDPDGRQSLAAVAAVGTVLIIGAAISNDPKKRDALVRAYNNWKSHSEPKRNEVGSVDSKGTNSGDEKKAGEANVRDNNKKGTKAEDEVASDLENAGRDVERQVRKDTPFGPRIIDIEVKDKDGNVLGGVEVKAGESRYRADQRSKDEWLRQNGYPVDLVRKK